MKVAYFFVNETLADVYRGFLISSGQGLEGIGNPLANMSSEG
jgi:hypothetical protein